ncbi:peptide MFS transporter [Streptomyces sp. NPDC056600]|uniref:peptide MFS transporter n=1 Tax=Streptomyces sp. NPDC056600 TaxID=3345874 RepID=UPI0036953852
MASSLTKSSPPAPGAEKTFFGHPRGLATLFMTEMWERFSYYGMRALLPLYLIADEGLNLDAGTAVAIYSVYVATVYLLALPGGWLGDRVWGPRKTTAIAAGVIMVGHLLLAVPMTAVFYVGLLFVAVGSGMLKSNISTMVGQLYDGPDDPRRDGGFTVFYMGINLGAFVAPLIIGTVGQTVDWHLGFMLAAVGMGLGLVQFLVGTKHLAAESSIVPKPLTPAERASTLRKAMYWLLVAVVFYGIVGGTGHFTLKWATVPLLVLGLLIPVSVLVRIKRDKDLTATEQSKVSGYLWFFAAAAIFWMIYDQGGSTLAIFADSHVDNHVFGWEFPVSWFQSVNALLIMALAPVFATIWLSLARKDKEPSTIVKFTGGLALIGISFFVFLLPLVASGDGKVSPYWLVLIYFVQTVAELMLSPVGLSVTTKMAPAKYASQMMGVWFLAVTAGDAITGLVAEAGVDLNRTGFVALEAALAVVVGIGIFLNRGKVKQLMGDVR